MTETLPAMITTLPAPPPDRPATSTQEDRTGQTPCPAALGTVARLRRRRVIGRILLLTTLLTVALAVRATGLLSPPAPLLPPMAGATLVAPGVIRAGPPQETELLLLRDSFRIRTVVAIGDVPAEEQAVTASLGMQLHAIPVAPAVAPTDQQVRTVVDVVRSTAAGGQGSVYLHDTADDGRSVAMAAMLQLVDRVPLDEVLRRMPPDHQLKLSAAQLQALRDAAAAISGPGTPNVPYTALREVTR